MGERTDISLRFKVDERLLVACMGSATQFQLFRAGIWKYLLIIFVLAFAFGVFYSQIDHLIDGIFENTPILNSPVFGLLLILFLARFGILWLRRKMARALVDTPSFRGDVQMSLDHSGVAMRTDVSHSFVQWKGVEAVTDLAQGLAFMIGGSTVPLPDTALPEGYNRNALKEQIAEWREAAQ